MDGIKQLCSVHFAPQHTLSSCRRSLLPLLRRRLLLLRPLLLSLSLLLLSLLLLLLLLLSLLSLLCRRRFLCCRLWRSSGSWLPAAVGACRAACCGGSWRWWPCCCCCCRDGCPALSGATGSIARAYQGFGPVKPCASWKDSSKRSSVVCVSGLPRRFFFARSSACMASVYTSSRRAVVSTAR